VQYDVNATAWVYRDSGYAPPSDEWTHGLMTFDGSVIRLYINGLEYDNSNESGTISDNTNSFCVGGGCDVGTFWFGGAIDDVRVYDRTLSAEEALRLYQLGQ
jgi:hypothetical protein